MKKFTLILLGIIFIVSIYGQEGRPDKEHLIISVTDSTARLDLTDRTVVPITTSFYGEESNEILVNREWGNMRRIQDDEAGFLFRAIEVRAEAENIRRALSDSLGITISEYFEDAATRNANQLNGQWDYQITNPNGTTQLQEDIVIDSLTIFRDNGDGVQGDNLGVFQWYSNNKIEFDVQAASPEKFFFVTLNRRKWLAEDPANARRTHTLRKK